MRIILFTAMLGVALSGCSSSSTSGGGGNPPDGGGVSNVEEKIVGKWELTTGGGHPAGTVYEFTKDGRLNIPVTTQGTTVTLNGSYKVHGTNVSITRVAPGGKEEQEMHSVKVLTDDKMVLAQGSKELNFTRKK